jgi:hypothetical protein
MLQTSEYVSSFKIMPFPITVLMPYTRDKILAIEDSFLEVNSFRKNNNLFYCKFPFDFLEKFEDYYLNLNLKTKLNLLRTSLSWSTMWWINTAKIKDASDLLNIRRG